MHSKHLAGKGKVYAREPGVGEGHSTDVWVGRCGWGAQTLTLFKTVISDFPTLFRFLRPRLNTFDQKQELLPKVFI